MNDDDATLWCVLYTLTPNGNPEVWQIWNTFSSREEARAALEKCWANPNVTGTRLMGNVE